MSPEWIEWKGGQCPVHEDDRVDVRIEWAGLSFENIPQDRIAWWEDAPLLYRVVGRDEE